MESYIEKSAGGLSFVGPEATTLFAAIALKSALIGYAKFKMQPNRHYTPTYMLKAAASLTGRQYKRGQHMQAAQDVAAWIETARAAILTKESAP